MKREILCPKCATKIRPVFMQPEPGEHYKFVSGKLRAGCFCDHCLTQLEHGDAVEALSIWSDHIPYSQWEQQYIE